MRIYTYRTIIEPDEKGYHGFVPLLRGVHTVGKTIEERQFKHLPSMPKLISSYTGN